MDKIRITMDDIPAGTEETPLWKPHPALRLVLLLFIPVFPLLCGAAILFRILLRNHPATDRAAWAAYFNNLLIVSGLLSLVAAGGIVAFTLWHGWGSSPENLPSSLGGRLTFPQLPSAEKLDTISIAEQIRNLSFVVEQRWGMGTGTLLLADEEGILIATCKHVISSRGDPKLGALVPVRRANGVRGAAQIVGYHQDLDLLLLWIRRSVPGTSFVQPVSPFDRVRLGEEVFSVGHPAGLEFSISNGLVSGKREEEIIQITAPVSPGNSGGPVYDRHGNLLGIVASVFNKRIDPNAENLNFAVRADALASLSGWITSDIGKKLLERFGRESTAARTNQP